MKRKTNINLDPRIGRHVEPATADLSVFAQVAEAGSFSAVAKARDVPVSQVSRAVSRLEGIYRVKLINRSTHGLSITSEGDLFLAYARQALASLSELDAVLDAHATEPSGLVRVSVSQVMADKIIVPSLPTLLDKHSKLRIEVVAEDRMIDLAAEGIDFAIRTNVTEIDHLVAKKLGVFKRGVYAAPSYLQRYGEPAEPEDLRRHRCITHAVAGYLNRWQFKVERRRVSMLIDGHHRFNNTSTGLNMVCSGVGIGRLSSNIVGAALADGSIVEVLKPYADPTCVDVYAVMLPDRHRLPKTKAFVAHLGKVFDAL